jgi:G5 domain
MKRFNLSKKYLVGAGTVTGLGAATILATQEKPKIEEEDTNKEKIAKNSQNTEFAASPKQDKKLPESPKTPDEPTNVLAEDAENSAKPILSPKQEKSIAENSKKTSSSNTATKKQEQKKQGELKTITDQTKLSDEPKSADKSPEVISEIAAENKQEKVKQDNLVDVKVREDKNVFAPTLKDKDMENRVVLVPKQTTVKLSDEKIKKSELVEKEVPFGEPVVLEDDTLEEGNTKEVSKGKNGIDYYDQNGVLVKQKQPVAPVILKGTKPKVSYNFIERTVKKDFKDFETQYINDDTMSIDAEPIVEKKGENGYTVYKETIRQSSGGKEEIVESKVDYIQTPRPAIVRRGTKKAEAPVAINTYRVTFLDGDGQIINNQAIEEGKAAIEPDIAKEKDGKVFVRWSANFDNIKQNMTIKAIYEDAPKEQEKTYRAIFKDASDNVVHEETLNEDAKPDLLKAFDYVTPPEGKTMIGWESESGNGQVIFRPKFADKTVFIQFFGEDNQLLFVRRIKYGTPIDSNSLPSVPSIDGKIFSGWSHSLKDFKEDTDVKAIYTKETTHLVTFYDADQTTILQQRIVKDGKGVQIPKAPQKDGYDFVGWSSDDLSHITSDTNVFPRYEKKKHQVSYYLDNELFYTQSVLHGEKAVEPVVPEKEGYTFNGWSNDGNNISNDIQIRGYYQKLPEKEETTSKPVIQAVDTNGHFIKELSSSETPEEIQGYNFESWDLTGDAPKGIYKLKEFNVNVKDPETQTVLENTTKTYLQAYQPNNEQFKKSGYSIVGYRNEQGETVDVSDLKVDKDITLYPIYKINTYTVKFFDVDNNVISSQEVEYGKSATLPENLSNLKNKEFRGWDKADELGGVKNNINVHPVYVETRVLNAVTAPVKPLTNQIVQTNPEQKTTKYIVREPENPNKTYNLLTKNNQEPTDLSSLGFRGKRIDYLGAYRIVGWKVSSENDKEIVKEAILGVKEGWRLADASKYPQGFTDGYDEETDSYETRYSDKKLPYRYRQDIANEIFKEVNKHRVSIGLKPLSGVSDSSYQAKTNERAEQMLYHFEHETPTRQQLDEFFGPSVSYLGENIQQSSGRDYSNPQEAAKGAVERWLNSKGHRKAIENPNYNYTTVSVVETKYGVQFVQNFYGSFD